MTDKKSCSFKGCRFSDGSYYIDRSKGWQQNGWLITICSDKTIKEFLVQDLWWNYINHLLQDHADDIIEVEREWLINERERVREWKEYYDIMKKNIMKRTNE
ncbi:MAG: hypothetical protein NZ954_08425 [Thermofilaceae archaeon]|nr:hypothetical protein [Thermofilaceae archaeon]